MICRISLMRFSRVQIHSQPWASMRALFWWLSKWFQINFLFVLSIDLKLTLELICDSIIFWDKNRLPSSARTPDFVRSCALFSSNIARLGQFCGDPEPCGSPLSRRTQTSSKKAPVWKIAPCVVTIYILDLGRIHRMKSQYLWSIQPSV